MYIYMYINWCKVSVTIHSIVFFKDLLGEIRLLNDLLFNIGVIVSCRIFLFNNSYLLYIAKVARENKD